MAQRLCWATLEPMSEAYRLIFRAEVLEGQHPAVVRKRLAEAAGFDDAQLDKLFSGKPVVVKRDADPATAARLQALFRSTGARLRAMPVDAPASDAAELPAATGAAEKDSSPSGVPNWELLPPGSDLLREEERPQRAAVDVDVSDLSLAPVQFFVPTTPEPGAGPDVSHLSLAAPGALLGASRRHELGPVQTPIFEVAEVGADLSPRRSSRPPPQVPDVSHLRIVDEA
jgi:hypothetical protein